MMYYIFSVTGISFIIGAVAVAVINQRREAFSRRGRWIKYFAYLAVVLVTGSAIIAGHAVFLAAAGVISVVGFYEIVSVGLERKSPSPVISRAMIIYMLFAFCFLGFAVYAPADQALILYFIVVLFDGFSQLSGQLFGKRGLSRISPNKTIEGSIGGFVLTMLCSFYLFKSAGAVSLIFLLLSCPAALAGDLLASLYKRKTGVKDYSSLIPGHGGVLDRFDSFIAVGAFYYLFMMMEDQVLCLLM
jgi:phosphatidate cytidylyltransferase